jgi:hypothetical protein
MNTSSDAIRAAESATERLELELEQLRSDLDPCATRLQLTEKLVEHAADATMPLGEPVRISSLRLMELASVLGWARAELPPMGKKPSCLISTRTHVTQIWPPRRIGRMFGLMWQKSPLEISSSGDRGNSVSLRSVRSEQCIAVRHLRKTRSSRE